MTTAENLGWKKKRNEERLKDENNKKSINPKSRVKKKVLRKKVWTEIVGLLLLSKLIRNSQMTQYISNDLKNHHKRKKYV